VELNVIVQVQYINSNKYNNSFKSRVQTFTPDENNCIEYCNVKDMRSQFLMWKEMQVCI